jgi:hypothetical protein
VSERCERGQRVLVEYALSASHSEVHPSQSAPT